VICGVTAASCLWFVATTAGVVVSLLRPCRDLCWCSTVCCWSCCGEFVGFLSLLLVSCEC